jgi:hypothetical protein
MKEKFDDSNKSCAFDFIIEEYFKLGFGTLNKSEIDLLFFSALLKYGDIVDTSDYSLSKLLQITQSRVRNLKVKNGLKYSPLDKQKVEEIFLEKAKAARVEKDGKRISIPVYDPNIYLELENLIERENGYVEAQLNPKIFTIRIDQFVGLLISIQSESDKKKVEELQKEYLEEIKEVAQKEDKFKDKIDTSSITSFKDIQKLILEKGVDVGLDLILSAVPGGTFVKDLTETIWNSVKK